LVYNGTICLVHEHDLSFWDIPSLSTNATKLSSEPEPSDESIARINIPFPDGQTLPNTSSWTGLCDWYTGSPQPLWLDIFDYDDQNLTIAFKRYLVSSEEKASTSIRLVTEFQLVPDRDAFVYYVLPYRVNGANIVFLWVDQTHIYFHTDSLLPSGEHTFNDTLYSVPGFSGSKRTVSLCPISGRLCYISKEDGHIKVIDFVEPAKHCEPVK